MTVRGCGIRDIAAITGYSKDKVQAALQRSEHEIKPTQKHYDVLQVDEFHTFIGHKKNKVWLIYAYHQKTSQIVALKLLFSKSLFYHIKVVNIGFAYINACHWRQCQKNRI